MPSQLYDDVKNGLPANVHVIEGREGDDLTITVDVNDMTFPFSVVFDGRTVIFGYVDRSETIPDLKSGVYSLGWAFSHGAKDWKHEIAAKVGRKAAKTLDARSEADKDRPFAVGYAMIVINKQE